MCFGNLNAKSVTMKKLKEMLDRIATGIKNKIGLNGSFAGNYQVAVITLKYK
jgi:hypothetical protein